VPGSGGITQARQRLGYEPMKELFSQVAAPVAEELTAGAFLGPWRLMAIGGFGWDAPGTEENTAAFGAAHRRVHDRVRGALADAHHPHLRERRPVPVASASEARQASSSAGMRRSVTNR
jgi:hypothetical protein